VAVAGATYTYSVVAYDASGNLSRASNSVTVKITAGGKGK
jgi:fibronectin type 3 domain-containing protein